jgi:hypothetical protein
MEGLMFRVWIVAVLVVFAATASAQQPEPAWDFWLKGQVLNYDNFFQAPEGSPEADVTALFGEVGASVRITGPLRAYGHVNTLHYDDDALDNSNGIRLGLRQEGRPHAFDVYGEQLMDRPTFDVGDEFDRADIRTFAGEYSYRFMDDWQVSVDGELQNQEFELTPARDNDFHAAGAAVRWRGSRLLSPEIGFRTGERDVDDATLSYDQRDLYLQLRSSPTPSLYISLRYRDRTREYSTGDALSPNFGREEDRTQWALGTDWTFTRNLALNLYAARENVDSNIAGRDFDTALYVIGLTWRR